MLPPSVVDEIEREIHIATIARNITVAGAVVVLYDHVLTFDDEIRLIWKAPSSFIKWIFLVNRYLTEVCLLAIANEMSGFSYTYNSKEYVFYGFLPYGVFSILTANLMAFLKVVTLWNKSPRVVFWLSSILLLSFLTSAGCMTASMIILAPYIEWSPVANICVLMKTTPTLTAVWAAPMIFEFSVLALTTYNALSLPRHSGRPLVRILHRDGMLFFLALLLLRGMNVVFSLSTNPKLIALTVFFSWAMVALGINRMMINIRSSEQNDERDDGEYESVILSLNYWASSDSTLRSLAVPGSNRVNRDKDAIELSVYYST
ncbi:hypothetical protein B0F90DRAFT_1820310 [Multifurca ochricompacta]|uniref:DUF6533 domain-containing protein n=1 Tax=Multifurca ochricompacta TaxID=376703 RepID=A0AAD4QL87_9AGAM|nr:hypothetical protein B0F90DRAFT_1820310 [Multifurca ochricompacta]